MSVNRWDPWRDIVSLREAMNSLLEESFVRPRAGYLPLSGALGVPMDVQETEDAFVATLALPGVDPEAVEISVLGDQLRVSGEIKDNRNTSSANSANGANGTNGANEARWLLRERRFGRFERTITLPAAPAADQASADFDKGILTIRLPKAESARLKTIPVRVNA